MFGFFPFATVPFADAGTVAVPVVVSVTGVSATGGLGTPTFKITANVLVVGVQGIGRVTRPLLWSPIVDNQTANWQNIDDGQTPVWTHVNTNQSSGWQIINDSQTGGWTIVNDNAPNTWDTIPT